MAKRRVLFVCTGNSARSQMAEGFLRTLAADRFEVASAGTRPAGLHSLAVEVMREAGIDISGQASKSLDAFVGQPFDHVITLCDRARESCPLFPGRTAREHWDFDDPAATQGTEEERKAVFRRVRDEIQLQIRLFLVALA